MQKIITREDLFRLLRSLSKDFKIVGPKELASKGVFYQEIESVEDLYLGPFFATEPIKKFFLEPSERIFKCEFKEGKNSPEDTPLLDKRRIVIGMRPCEARGLALLDMIFDAKHKDSSYINNRKRSIVIGLACSKPDRTCFCTSLGGSPVDSRAMDILLLDKEDGFAADIITEKGKELFGAIGRDLNEDEKRLFASEKEKNKKAVEIKGKIPETLDDALGSDYWSAVSMPCLSCGVCTYLCPTCHCFDLVDEERTRLRCYDGCAFPDFTLEASRENPRPTKKERYRQRVFHKFDYFKKNFGENLCVGCGRCIRYCPVKIDISQIVTGVPAVRSK